MTVQEKIHLRAARSSSPVKAWWEILAYLVQETRLDMVFVMHYLDQPNANFTLEHWEVTKDVTRYLQGMKEAGITHMACRKRFAGHSHTSCNQAGDGHSRSRCVFTMSKGPAVGGSRSNK